MRTITTTVYDFDELNDAAKAKARDWYREASVGDSDFADFVIEDATEIAKLLGIEIDKHGIAWSGFSSQGDGASFAGTWRASLLHPVDAIKEHAPADEQLHRIAKDLHTGINACPHVSANLDRRGYRYTHERTIEITVLRCDDEDNDLPEDEANDRLIAEALFSFMRWVYARLEAEHDYQMSDEQVDETIRANEYTFTEDGRRKG